MAKDKLEKKGFSKGKFEGYKFQEDNIANQMAFLFANEEGEKEAARIAKEAQERYPNPIQMVERKKFIEDEVRKRAETVDTKFQNGLLDIFNTLKDKKEPLSGEEAGKELAFNLMKGLGLNVDKDNLQTHYDPGPPQVFQITWINRPSKNLADENSNINKLAQNYADNCDQKQKEEFNKNWKNHVDNAKIGGPKMDKQEFLEKADKSFKETVEHYKKQDLSAPTDSKDSQEEANSMPHL